MTAKQELLSIIKNSNLNAEMLFVVKDKFGKTHHVPLHGILDCIVNLRPKRQQKVLKCFSTRANNPDELIRLFKYLALRVVSRRI